MHPAPSLLEASSPDRTGRKANPARRQQTDTQSEYRPSPDRDDSDDAIPVVVGKRRHSIASTGTVATRATSEASVISHTAEDPPSFTREAVFSIKDGGDIAASRRASRRRTGPLSAAQREKAAIIRRLGACYDCRRRRVAVGLLLLPLTR